MDIKIRDSESPGSITFTFHDCNAEDEWLSAEAIFVLNGFTAEFGFDLMLPDLLVFYKELQRLYSDLRGVAELKTIEDNVHLIFSIDESGHVYINGTLKAQDFSVATTFKMETDQTYLPEILNGCRNVLVELENHIE